MEMHLKKCIIRDHIQYLQRARRKFSTSCVLSHGHIDPPKPGEEYVFMPLELEGQQGLMLIVLGFM